MGYISWKISACSVCDHGGTVSRTGHLRKRSSVAEGGERGKAYLFECVQKYLVCTSGASSENIWAKWSLSLSRKHDGAGAENIMHLPLLKEG